MAGTSRLDGPKVAMIGSLVSDNKGIVPYVFRNYNFPAMVTSNYRGSVRYKVWEAVRASSAAPGYFDECLMNKKVFQDGGMSSNNSTHIGIHEAQQLWPGEPLQSVVRAGRTFRRMCNRMLKFPIHCRYIWVKLRPILSLLGQHWIGQI